MRILALDLGTLTGWALGDERSLESGVQVFDLRRGESPGMRYIRFRSWLGDMLSRHEPAIVTYEQAHLRGGHAAELLTGLATRVQEMAAAHGIEHQPCHSATLKKFATGRGNADKKAMLAAARQRWPGQMIATDDQADALWLLAWAQEQFAGAIPKGGTP